MTDYRDAVARRAPAITRGGGGDIRGAGWVIAYTDEPQLLIEHPDGSKEWWLARLTDVMDEPPAQAAQDRPRRDETPDDGGRGGSGNPIAPEGRPRNSDAMRARYCARRATELGGRAGIAEGLAAIAHALLAAQEDQPR